MSQIAILSLSTRADQLTDVTADVQKVLNEWNAKDLLPGDVLCCVTMATRDAGLVVGDANPGNFNYWFGSGVHVLTGYFPFSMDLGRLRALLPRTSEIFLLRGPKIQGGKRIYVMGAGEYGKCEVAMSLL